MKKFSNITNQKVGEEPKKELKQFNFRCQLCLKGKPKQNGFIMENYWYVPMDIDPPAIPLQS